MANHNAGMAGKVSSGVEQLITRLREEGVQQGREEAQRIVEDAERRATWLTNQARAQAEEMLIKARDEAERLRRSGEEALQIAARDAVLNMKGFLGERFAIEVRRLIGEQLRDEALLREMILTIAGRVREDMGLDQVEQIEVLLPRDVIGLDELRRHPETLKEGSLSHFVLAIAQSLLREGVTFNHTPVDQRGITLRLTGQDLEVELTDEAIARLLLAHLQPRFRALLEGIVR
ncbi:MULTISPECIES: hypothetical protein [Nitrosomonas]|uniref:V/A-type H+-transporting ATPase subunit E n=1 Tax=Nitrosomonas halophila TaxID=44576 RepID=A0A1H3MM08_9PROT|nr:hypothetical protein [Nitrosomonas halophila]SDY77782.1 V/A-type H+-transporting ATPase subunit E [Nitrosomonas halophila]